MKPDKTVLVMAGAREAHGIVTALLALGRAVTVSLPEPERLFETFAVPTRIGRFESASVFETWAHDLDVETVIDASHAFDASISHMVSEVCRRRGWRYVRVLRAPWRETAQDRWQHVDTVRNATMRVPEGARVFANTGWMNCSAYVDFRGEVLFLRQTQAPQRAAPFSFVQFIQGHPPFTQFQEQALFESLRISHLMCRNVGGAASMSKLLAARAMQMPVLMVGRPATPVDRTVLETVAQALDWEAAG